MKHLRVLHQTSPTNAANISGFPIVRAPKFWKYRQYGSRGCKDAGLWEATFGLSIEGPGLLPFDSQSFTGPPFLVPIWSDTASYRILQLKLVGQQI